MTILFRNTQKDGNALEPRSTCVIIDENENNVFMCQKHEKSVTCLNYMDMIDPIQMSLGTLGELIRIITVLERILSNSLNIMESVRLLLI